MAEERVVLELDLDSSKAAEAAKKVIEIEDAAQRRRNSAGGYESRFVDRGRLEEEIDRKRMQRELQYFRFREENLRKLARYDEEIKAQMSRYDVHPPVATRVETGGSGALIRQSRDRCDDCIICCCGCSEGKGGGGGGRSGKKNDEESSSGASAISRVTAVLGAAYKGAKIIGELANAANSYTEAAQFVGHAGGLRAAIGSTAIGSGALGLIDKFTGREFQMRSAERAHTQAMMIEDIATRGNFAGVQARNTYQAAERNLTAANVIYTGPTASSFDRGTALGEQRFLEEMRRVQGREALNRAEKGIASANQGVEQQARENQKYDRLRNETAVWLRNAQANYDKSIQGWFGGGKNSLVYSQEIQQASSRLKMYEDLLNEGKKELNARQQTRALAESTLAKAKAQVQADLPNINARLEQSQERFQTLGSMDRFQRQYGVQALKYAQQFGLDNIPPELRAAAGQLAPNTIGRMQEEAARNSPERKQLEALAPADFRVDDDPAKLRKMQGEAMDILRKAAEKAEQDSAKQIQTLAKGLADIVVSQTSSQIKKALEEFKQEMNQAFLEK